jgi:NTP pyrophosphatase (non-canonical NTP hydrolase)
MSLKPKSQLAEQAQEFRTAFRVSNTPTATSTQRTLIVEEFKEFLESEAFINREHPAYRENTLKELADLVYVCYQYAANLSWDLDEALDRVHRSNMSKLDDNGQPIYRADGKVLKGPNYQPPYLQDLV